MSSLIKLSAWCATVAVFAMLVSVRPCLAQDGPGKIAAVEAADEAIAEESGGGPNPLAVDPDLAIWTLVVFVILFLVLGKFAWPQITAALEERERKIADNIAAAKALNEDAKRLLAEHRQSWMLPRARCGRCWTKPVAMRTHTRKQIEAEGHRLRKKNWTGRCGKSAGHAMRPFKISRSTSANVAVDLARGVVRRKSLPIGRSKSFATHSASLARQHQQATKSEFNRKVMDNLQPATRHRSETAKP